MRALALLFALVAQPAAQAIPLGEQSTNGPRFMSYSGEPRIGQPWNVFMGNPMNRYTNLGLMISTSGRKPGDTPLDFGPIGKLWLDTEQSVMIVTTPWTDYAVSNEVFGIIRRGFFDEIGTHIQDGYINFWITIPNDPTLVGVNLWLQGVGLMPGLMLSQGLLLRFGT